ncbi:ABC transporter ATP-binding protein [Actinotalea subterranea]|uniref:ABC transporter ATP-binding protein n=1 Tax=Actinotalea subterranea TaxID=2607497 RepID=UPI0011EC787B|nr:ATP-binding cassette domain-containing protein [Actinotalea subterranea]
MSAVLSGHGLGLAFGPTTVLHDVDIALDPGEIVAVLGASGSGKSTLLHVLAGLLRPDAGSVELDGRRIDHLADRERSELRLRRFGFVFQLGDLVPELTVVENVELPLRLTGVARRLARSQAMEILADLAVADVAARRVNEVSGGQAQRAAVARALVHRPAVVLADEPTGSLDTVTGELVLEAFVRAARAVGTAVLLVTHEARVASWASREVQLRDGCVVAPATTS